MEKKSNRVGTVVFIIIIAVIFISMSVILVLQNLDKKSLAIAEIYQNGVLATVVNIADSEGYNLTLDDGDGGYNIISVKGGKIGVSETNCPDKTCFKMGFINDGRFPIICLPHRVEIRLVSTLGVDGISY